MPAIISSYQDLDQAGEAALYRAVRRFWHPVMYAADLKDRPAKVFLMGEQLAVMRLGGQVRAFADLCVHRGTALSLGRIEGEELRCAYHGWTYNAEGACTRIPARFGLNIPPRARLRPYLAAEKCGLIWVCLEDEPEYPLPEFPEWDNPHYRVVAVPPYEWNVGSARRVENYVDFAHFAWVHDGLLGDHNRPEVPDHEVWREGAELRMKIEVTQPPSGGQTKGLGPEGGDVRASSQYRIFIPYSIWLHQTLNNNPDYNFVLFMAASPLGQKRTRAFTFIARSHDLGGNDQKYVDFQELIVSQDKPIAESQRPEELPVDLSAELHIRGVDRVSIEYRKWLIELANRFGGNGRE
jgi:vanillate O-demethylase monooxygenase subunit